MSGRFAGRTAVITGASGGIGRSVRALLERDGAHVVGWDVGGGGVPVDVGDRGSVERAARALNDGPDLLVHAAGVHRGGGIVDRGGEIDDLMRVNLMGTANVLAVIGALMRARGRGAIVTIASDAAVVPRPTMAMYGATKAAALQLALAAALELAPSGVRCNVVCPGATDTPMQRALWDGPEPPPGVIAGDPSGFRSPIPLGRIGQPDDVASLVGFLLSDEARHITAQRVMVDGGGSLGR